jgi:hypothetical protein
MAAFTIQLEADGRSVHHIYPLQILITECLKT